MSTVTLVAVGITTGAITSVGNVLVRGLPMSTVTHVIAAVLIAKTSVTSVLLMSHTTPTTTSTVTLVAVGITAGAKTSVTSVLLMSHSMVKFIKNPF